MHKLYDYLNKYSDRAKVVRKLPIFLDQNGKAVPAFDNNDELILFLPDNGISDLTVVKKELLANNVTGKFIEKLGIKKPSIRDRIYNRVLPEYAKMAKLILIHTSKCFLSIIKTNVLKTT